MKKRILSFMLVLAMGVTLPANALASAPAKSSKAFRFDDDLIIIGSKSLTAKKSNSGTAYWDLSPKEFMDGFHSIYGSEFKLGAFKKSKDKNIYTCTIGKSVVQLHSTSDTYSKGKLTKVVLQLNHTTRSSDFETFGMVLAGVTTIFSQYDEKAIMEILESLGFNDPNNDGTAKTYTYKSAKYQMNYDNKKIVLSITPAAKS